MTEEREIGELREALRQTGVEIEKRVVGGSLQYMFELDASLIRESVRAKWEVFEVGYTWSEQREKDVTVTPEDAMTGKVLNARALLVLAAIGEEKMTHVLLAGLTKALTVKGGSIWKGGEKVMTAEQALDYAREFIGKACSGKSFHFGKNDGEEQEIILNRLGSMINTVYYILATAALGEKNPKEFEMVQNDLLLSANFRLPIIKGWERSLDDAHRNYVLGFAQAAPINHIPPGCLSTMMERMVE